MPGDCGDGAADGLFQVLADPPVVLFFEVADCYYSCAGTDREFTFGRRPADEGGGSIDAQED